MNASDRNKYLYLMLPCLAGLAGWFALQDMLPAFMGYFDYDPAYVYLVNGLDILTGHSPGHVDHPGTPLQLFCSIFIILTWASIRFIDLTSQGLAASVFENPELYIAVISHALLLLNVWALAFAGQRIHRATGSLFLMLIIQSTPFIFTPYLYSALLLRMSYLAPEALLLFSSNVLIGILAKDFFQPVSQHTIIKIDYTALLAGAICGFAIAVKVTFLPVVLLLAVLRTPRRIIVSAAGVLATLSICLLPIISQLPKVFSWLGEMGSHTGKYGSGSLGAFNFEAMPVLLNKLCYDVPLFFIIAAVIAAAIIVKLCIPTQRTAASTGYIVPVTLFMVMFLQTIAVLKHFGFHYLLPALPVSLLGLSWLIFWLYPDSKPGIISRLIRPALFTVCICFGVTTTVIILKDIHYDRELATQRNSQISSLIKSTPNLLLVGSYRCELKKFAITFALARSALAQNEAAVPYISDFVEYIGWNKKIRIINEKQSTWAETSYLKNRFRDGRNIIICATTRNFSIEGIYLEPVLNLGPRFIGAIARQTFYRVIDVDFNSMGDK